MKKLIFSLSVALILGHGVHTANAQDFNYTALTVHPAAVQGTVVAGGLSWHCQSTVCKIRGPWPTPGVIACKALAQRVGKIKSYGHSAAHLTAQQLQQCNATVAAQSQIAPPTTLSTAPLSLNQVPQTTKPASKGINQAGPQPEPPTHVTVPPASKAPTSTLPAVKPRDIAKGGPQPEPPTRPAVSRPSGSAVPHAPSSTLPAVTPRDIAKGGPQPEPPTRPGGFAPGAGSLPGSIGVPASSGGFAPSAPPRDAAETINNAIADLRTRPTIEQVIGDATGVNCAARSFRVAGRNFGASAGSHHLMLLNPRDNSPIRALSTYTWSDNSINSQMPEPSYGHPGQTYKVGIMDDSHRLLSNVHEVRLCANTFRFSGSIRLANCAAGTSDTTVKVMNGSTLLATARARVSASSDFVFEYSAEIPASNSADITLVPQMRSGVCNGGAWSLPNIMYRMSYSRMSISQDFNYGVGMQEVRVDGNLVAGIINDQFRDLRIHINTLAPSFTRPNSRYLANDTFIQMPSALGGTRVNIPLEEVVSGAFRYYLNDINLSSLTIRAIDNRFRMRLAFESAGNEVKGFCWDGVCLPLGDAGAPDGNVDNLTVDVFFTPVRFNIGRGTGGDITIGNIEANIQANLSGTGIAGPIVALLEGAIKDQFFPQLERTISDMMQQRSFKEAVARGIRSSLDSPAAALFLGNIGNVQGVRMERNNVIISFLPR